MTTSAELLPELVGLGGDLDHLSADLEERSQLVDAARSGERVPQEVTRHEQLAGEGIGLTFDLSVRAVDGVEVVVPELVSDRETLAPLRLRCDDLDASVDETGAETAEVIDLDDLETGTPSDRVNGNRRLRDVVLGEDAAGHVTSVRRMRFLLTARTTRDSEQLPSPLVLVGVDRHRRSTALRALVLEARRGRPAVSAFLVSAAQIGHNQAETDYRPVSVHLIEGCRNPAAALVSLCRRRFGDARTVEGATMDKKERKVFAEVNRLRDDQGLGEKLDRYRQSRDQYERLLKGRQENSPSVPLQRTQQQTSAHGRIRGVVDGTR
jgi:hypothetical protein